MGIIVHPPRVMYNYWLSLAPTGARSFGKLGSLGMYCFSYWLAIQNRIWTSERLIKCGWLNRGPCPLYKGEQETIEHLFFKCRYTRRFWVLVKDWLHLVSTDISDWATSRNIKDGGLTWIPPTRSTTGQCVLSLCLLARPFRMRGPHRCLGPIRSSIHPPRHAERGKALGHRGCEIFGSNFAGKVVIL